MSTTTVLHCRFPTSPRHGCPVQVLLCDLTAVGCVLYQAALALAMVCFGLDFVSLFFGLSIFMMKVSKIPRTQFFLSQLQEEVKVGPPRPCQPKHKFSPLSVVAYYKVNAFQTVAHFAGAVLIASFISEEWDYRSLWRVHTTVICLL